METGKLSYIGNRSSFYSALFYEFIGTAVVVSSYTMTA
jgi:hypothetical protein